jgi:hypothetical protein
VGKWVENESANSRVLEEVVMLRYCGKYPRGFRGRSDPKRASSKYEVASIKVKEKSILLCEWVYNSRNSILES